MQVVQVTVLLHVVVSGHHHADRQLLVTTYVVHPLVVLVLRHRQLVVPVKGSIHQHTQLLCLSPLSVSNLVIEVHRVS